MSDDSIDLKAVYSPKTSTEARRFYDDWAECYESGFAAHEDYRLHVETANAFVEAGGQGPVLDVGAGTGFCGAVLADFGVGPIDAVDISEAMLAIAMRKDIYRDAIVADLDQGVPVPPDSYAGIVSS